ncbi:MAG: hypothetical protein ACO26U_05500 [Burkholderiaceae bacterium]
MRNTTLPQLMTGPADRHATLGAFGSPIHHQHAQLRAMLMARQRKDLADYFARPIQDTDSGEIRWLAEIEGTPCRFEQLGPQDASAVRDKLARIQADLAALARTFRSLPGAAQASAGTGPAFAALLEGAQRVPETGDFLFAVDGQPVIAFWGFRDHQGQGVIPSPPPLPVAPAPATRPPASPVVQAVAANKPVADSTRRRWPAWLGWLLALLLVSAVLAWWFFHRTEADQAAQVQSPPQVSSDPTRQALPATEGREAQAPMAISPEALARGDLSFLQGLWQVGKGRISLYAGSPDNVTGSARDVLEFGPDGRGRHHTLEGMSHGRGETRGPPIEPCSGDLSASVKGKTLLVDLGPCMTEGSAKPQYSARRFECSISEQGATECKTVNHDGHRWKTDLLRIH